jgi:hypothetical protein
MPEQSDCPNYQEFVRLLYSAYHASEAVDYFDLRSEDPASRATWTVLREEQRKEFLTLVEHLRDHAAEITAYLGGRAGRLEEP